MSADRKKPGNCPDVCSWVVTVQSGEATALRGVPGIPIRAGHSVRRSTASSSTRPRPISCSIRSHASAAKEKAGFRQKSRQFSPYLHATNGDTFS